MIKVTFAILAATTLTIVPALLQGRFSNRWGEPPNLTLAGKQLHEFPREVGAWHCIDDEKPLSVEVCRELGLVEHFHRIYTHRDNGNRLEVLLMVGPPGRLVRHPPDICYANRANQQIGEAMVLEVASQSTAQRFKLLNFQRKEVPRYRKFSVAYAYAADDGIWKTPTSPRVEFGAATVLYKLQVLSELPLEGDDSLREFLSQFVESFPAVLADDAKAPISL